MNYGSLDSELGGAKAGDRTMLDALVPAVTVFEEALRSGEQLGDTDAHGGDAQEVEPVSHTVAGGREC